MLYYRYLRRSNEIRYYLECNMNLIENRKTVVTCNEIYPVLLPLNLHVKFEPVNYCILGSISIVYKSTLWQYMVGYEENYACLDLTFFLELRGGSNVNMVCIGICFQ